MYEDACMQHMDQYDHWVERYPRETCPAEFWTQEAADTHMAWKRHYNYYCNDCDRAFADENALQMVCLPRGGLAHGELCQLSSNNLPQHLHSRGHQEEEIWCPFCREGFVTSSGVCHHLESGFCPCASDLNRETVHRKIQCADPNEIITTKEVVSNEGVQELERVTEPQTVNKSQCSLRQKQFKHSGALAQHVNSPAHKCNYTTVGTKLNARRSLILSLDGVVILRVNHVGL